MECAEAREHLTDLNRGRLGADLAEAVRAHVRGCADCAAALKAEAQVRALIQARAPRYAAPPGLRARVEASLAGSPARGRSAWRQWLRGHAWMTGSLAGAAALLVVVWAGSLWLARDPVSRLVASATEEHAEYAKELMSRPAPDPATLVRELRSQVDFSFEPVFAGDSGVQLVAAMVSKLSGKQAATLVYRDAGGTYTTLFIMPGAGTTIPEGDRLSIETFKPYHRVASGHHLLLWKQRDLACLVVSDLDEMRLATMFLKIRKAA